MVNADKWISHTVQATGKAAALANELKSVSQAKDALSIKLAETHARFNR